MDKKLTDQMLLALLQPEPAHQTRRLVVAGTISAGKLRQLVDATWAAQEVVS
jgi:hypothetical protein